MSTDRLRAELSFRVRSSAPKDWAEFSLLWVAFNALYGGELHNRERARAMALVRRLLSENAARRVLRVVRPHVDRILALPPGNLMLNRYDPHFRAASARLAALYRNPRETARGRAAAVAGVLYQVRCNLIHGSKDPNNQRDRMLVTESKAVLEALVPALEASA